MVSAYAENIRNLKVLSQNRDFFDFLPNHTKLNSDSNGSVWEVLYQYNSLYITPPLERFFELKRGGVICSKLGFSFKIIPSGSPCWGGISKHEEQETIISDSRPFIFTYYVTPKVM